MKFRFSFYILLALALNACSHREETKRADLFPAWQVLSGRNFENWSGIDVAQDSGAATLQGSGEAIFRYPDGPKGWIKHGFRLTNDGTADWHACQGLKLDIHLPDDRPEQLTAFIGTPNETAESDMVRGTVTVQGSGWHTVTLPWSAFAFEQANTTFLQYAKELRLTVRPTDGTANGAVLLKTIRVMEGDPIALQCDFRGKSALPGQAVDYDVSVSNCSEVSQSVALSFVKHGWEAMTATVEPASLDLAPGETKPCVVHVAVPDRVAPGGHEEQVLQAIANGAGDKSATLTLITAHALPHPYILHTAAAWQEIRDKVKKYPWAKAAQDDYIAQAEKWDVSAIAQSPHNDPDDTMGPFLFATANEHGFMACGIAWQLTGEKKYAEKVAEFLRRWSDPQKGYPTTFRGCNQGFVQEGHFTQHIAMSYDMILDSGVLSPADIEQIDQSLRLDMQTIDLGNQGGAINNWNLSELSGAFYCAPRSAGLGGVKVTWGDAGPA